MRWNLAHHFDAIIFLLSRREEPLLMSRFDILKSFLFIVLWFSWVLSMRSSGFPFDIPFIPNQLMIESSIYSIEFSLKALECDSIVSTEFLISIEWFFSFNNPWHEKPWLRWSDKWLNSVFCCFKTIVSMWFSLNNLRCN